MSNTKTKSKKVNVLMMTELALLSAIIILMAFTPLGYLRIGVTQITFIVVPVAVGAVILGPLAGAFLGLVFGISSLLQPESLALFGMIPWQTVVVTIVPRIFVGLVPGLVFQGLQKVCKKRTVNTAIACVLAPLTNTVLFLSFTTIFVGQFLIEKNPDIYGALAGKGFFAFFGAMVAGATLNIILEASSCLIIGTAVCNALWVIVKKNRH